MRKRVSIVMCTYNGEAYLKEQMDSLLSQTCPADEIVVMDDCSTDGTYDILCDYQQRFPHCVRVERNDTNLGINTNFFNALSLAEGDFIAISDQDDIWEPDKLEKQLQAIGEKWMCACCSRPFTTTGADLRFDRRVPNYSLLRQVFVGCLPGHTMLISRRLLDALPDWTGVERMYDVILSMLAAAYDSIIYLDAPLVNRRIHVTSATYTPPTENQWSLITVWQNVMRTWRYNRLLKPEIRRRLCHTLNFLDEIKSESTAINDARKLLRLYVSRSPFAFLKLQWFCITRCDQLFYSAVRRSPLTFLRAAYFPVSCSEYFRFLLPKHLRRHLPAGSV